MIKGIDISSWNKGIDYNKVKNSGIGFAIIRSSYGWFHEDNEFRNHVKGCEAVGLPYGLYHYSYALNLEQAKIEADGLINLAKSCNPTYPIILDMEDADGYKAKHGFPSKEMLVQICEYILDRLEKAGYYAMLYANKSWFDTKLNDARLNRFDKWLAHWGIKQPSMSCGIWQYTSDGQVAGINGRVDMNYAYKDYPAIIKNMGTVTPVEPTPAPVEPVGETTYTVVAGDTLSGIAAKYGTTYQKLAEYNGIADPNKIYVGQVIKIPSNNSTPVDNSIKVGDKVKVLNAVQYNGQPFKTWHDVYDVIEVAGDRAVIGVGNAVTCAINIKNIQKV